MNKIYSDYLLIRMWGERHGLSNVDIINAQKLAHHEDAPLNSVYSRALGWETLDNVECDIEFKELLKKTYKLVLEKFGGLVE